MLSQVVRNAPGALTGIPKEYPEEGPSRDCGDKGRFQVHVLLGLFTDKDIEAFHMSPEG